MYGVGCRVSTSSKAESIAVSASRMRAWEARDRVRLMGVYLYGGVSLCGCISKGYGGVSQLGCLSIGLTMLGLGEGRCVGGSDQALNGMRPEWNQVAGSQGSGRGGQRGVFFFTLVTGPKRSLRLKLSDTRVYEPQIRDGCEVALQRTLRYETASETSSSSDRIVHMLRTHLPLLDHARSSKGFPRAWTRASLGWGAGGVGCRV